MTPPPAADHKIADLQHLRGISVLMILFTHLSLVPVVLGVFPHAVVVPFWLGVEVFFVVSGYVIVNALARDRYEPLAFYVKRVCRLSPAAVGFLMVSAGVFALFLHAGAPDDVFSELAHGVTKERAALQAARANGWNESLAWDRGARNLTWDEMQQGWAQEAEAGGMTPADATAAARAARTEAEKKWRLDGWQEFGQQGAATLGGYQTLRGAYGSPVPQMFGFAAIWSLAVEDQFYAVMGLGCLVAAVLLRRAAPRVLPWVIGGGAAVLYLFAVAVRLDAAFDGDYWGYFRHPAWIIQMKDTAYAADATDSDRLLARFGDYLIRLRFDYLALGILTAYFDRRCRGWVDRKLADRGPFLAVLLLGGPLAVAAIAGRTDGPTVTGWLLLIAGWCFAPLVILATHDKLLPAARGSGARVLRYFGDRSYTMYLLHLPLMALTWYLLFVGPTWLDAARPGEPPVAKAFADWLMKPGAGRYAVAQLLLMTVLLPLTTEAIYRGVELPCIRVGKWLAKKVRIIPPEVPAVVVSQPAARAA